jgi:hypothetical protein
MTSEQSAIVARVFAAWDSNPVERGLSAAVVDELARRDRT